MFTQVYQIIMNQIVMNILKIKSLALETLLLFLNIRISIKLQFLLYHYASFSENEEEFWLYGVSFNMTLCSCCSKGRINTFVLKSSVFSPKLYTFLLCLYRHTERFPQKYWHRAWRSFQGHLAYPLPLAQPCVQQATSSAPTILSDLNTFFSQSIRPYSPHK